MREVENVISITFWVEPSFESIYSSWCWGNSSDYFALQTLSLVDLRKISVQTAMNYFFGLSIRYDKNHKIKSGVCIECCRSKLDALVSDRLVCTAAFLLSSLVLYKVYLTNFTFTKQKISYARFARSFFNAEKRKSWVKSYTRFARSYLNAERRKSTPPLAFFWCTSWKVAPRADRKSVV